MVRRMLSFIAVVVLVPALARGEITQVRQDIQFKKAPRQERTLNEIQFYLRSLVKSDLLQSLTKRLLYLMRSPNALSGRP